MSASAAELKQTVRRAAMAAGFDLSGIAPVRREQLRELEYFAQFVAAGHAAEMHYLEAKDEQGRFKRASLEQVAPWARSVIVCALNYNTAVPYSTESGDPRRGWISRYAWGGPVPAYDLPQKGAINTADYHQIVLTRLRTVEGRLREMVPGLESRCYVDTGPVVERVYARHAGIGWIGKNTCLINQQLGSWLFLGVILTSLELAPEIPPPDRCGSCTRCLDACPTQAFVAPHRLDASRCISYLTIEKRGVIGEELRPGMGRQVFGCDICQDVCPWNRRAPVATAAEFQPNPQLVNPALEWLATISHDEFRATFRRSPVRRAKRSGLRRNAVIAMGNSMDQSYVPLLEKLAQDEDNNVAEHAAWAVRRLRGSPPRLVAGDVCGNQPK